MNDQQGLNFEIFGQYLLLNRIAYGGMAAIYLARPATSTANGRILVLKRILPHVADDPSFIKMFKSEIQVCMGFHHPNLVQIFDFGHSGQQPYIAMEYVEGKNLREITSKFTKMDKKVPIGVAVSVAAQAAAGLHYAHTFKNHVTGDALKIIHRDISPQNILLSYEGNVKIIDFGIAKSEVEFADKTRTGSIKGKVSYLSPEQLFQEEIDGRSDVFSLGAVLWELLTGRKLFHLLGRGDIEVMEMIANCEKVIKPPSTINPEVPPALDEIVLKSLAKKREDRYQSAQDFQKALRNFIIKELPGFSYRDVGDILKEAFQEELIEERMYVQTLNEKAQEALLEQTTKIVADPLGMPNVPRFAGVRSLSNPNIVPPPAPPEAAQVTSSAVYHHTSYMAAPATMTGQAEAHVLPQKIKEQFYIKLTFGRALALMVYAATFFVLRVDQDQKVLAAIFGDPEAVVSEPMYIREASLDPSALDEAQPAQPAVQQVAAPRVVHPVKRAPAVQKPSHSNGNRSVLLRINLVSKDGTVPTGLSVNQYPINLKNPVVRVLLDKQLYIQIQRKGSKKPIYKNVLLSSNALKGSTQYTLDIPLTKAGR